jgi:hypothetical protein
MRAFNRCIVIAGMAGAMAWVPSLIAQEKDRDQGSEQEAIRFEKAKQAAADRQERIEAGEARQHRQKAPMVRGDTDTRRHGDTADRTAPRKDAPAHNAPVR